MEQVTPGIKRKDHFVIVDSVGVCERTRPMRAEEKKPNVAFEKLLQPSPLAIVNPKCWKASLDGSCD